ncbi:MAG: rod shape-determining protein [Rickettsiales bacterium]|jgi:cell division protein FtsA|nr:rod shape-determining protein [Rickettsiales bacterium]
MAKNFINIIDIGSSKITILVATPNPLTVVAFKRFNLSQLQYISLNDPAPLGKIIAGLMDEIERDLPNFKFKDAYVCINSFNIETSLQGLTKNLSLTNPISQEDLDTITQNISSQKYVNKKIIHSFALRYILDNQKYSINPIGSYACYLTMQTLFITLPQEEYKTIENMIHNCHIGLNKVICAPYASSLSFSNNLKQSEKALIIEIGSHFTNLLFFSRGILLNIEIFNKGIASIIKQLTYKFNISEKEALYLIKENSCIKPNDAHLRTVNLNQLQPNGQTVEKSHNLDEILSIISDYLNQFFAEINDLLEKRNFKNNLQKVILTGGGANIKNIDYLASQHIGVETQIRTPVSVEGFEEAGPQDASLIGSLLYASYHKDEDITPRDMGFYAQLKHWIKENL